MGGDKLGLQKRLRAGNLKWSVGSESRGKSAGKQRSVMFNAGMVQQRAQQDAPGLPTGVKSEDGKVTKTEVIPVAEIAGIVARLQGIMLAIGDMVTGFAIGGAAGMATTVLSSAVNGIAKLESGFAVSRSNHPLRSLVSGATIAPALGSYQTKLAKMGTRSLGGMLPEKRSSSGLSSFVEARVAPMSSIAFNSDRNQHYIINVQRRAAVISAKSPLWQGNDRAQGTAGKLHITPNKAAQMEAMRVVSLSENRGSMQFGAITAPPERQLYPGPRYNGDSMGGDVGRPRSRNSNSRQNEVGRSVHIHLDKPLIERFTIEVKDAKEGLSDFKRKVEEVLLEILNSANLIK